MADAAEYDVLFSDSKRYVIHLLNISDGTGESAAQKIDISGLTGPDGTAPTSLTLMEVDYDIGGFSSVQILTDHGTDEKLVVLPVGSGYKNFIGVGGKQDPGSGGSGDILVTTVGASSTATYDITLHFKLED